MAKMLFGPVYTDARGKIAGVVASRNAAGAFLRRHSSPGASTTAATQKAKSQLSATAKSWASTLTPAQRAAWIAWAATFTILDKFGNNIHLTGEAAFIQVGSNLKVLGLSPLASPPANRTVTNPGSITVSCPSLSPVTLQVATTNNPLSYEAAVIIAHAPQSQGRKGYSAKSLSVIVAEPLGTIGPWNPTNAYLTKYEEIPYLYGIVLGVYFINSQNGAASLKYVGLVIPNPYI